MLLKLAILSELLIIRLYLLQINHKKPTYIFFANRVKLISMFFKLLPSGF